MISLEVITVFVVALFCIGMFGIVSRRNAFFVLFSLEIILNSLGIFLVALSRHVGNINGEIFTLFVLAIAASESAVGLAFLLSLFRTCKTVDLNELIRLRW